MQESKNSPGHSEFESNPGSVMFVHTVSGAGRLLPSSSRWNSIELDFNVLPQSSNGWDSIPPKYSRSINFDLTIKDHKRFRLFVILSASIITNIFVLILLLSILPRRKHHHGNSKDLTLALNQALLFFDAQKCKLSCNDLYTNSFFVTFLYPTNEIIIYQKSMPGNLILQPDLIQWTV